MLAIVESRCNDRVDKCNCNINWKRANKSAKVGRW